MKGLLITSSIAVLLSQAGLARHACAQQQVPHLAISPLAAGRMQPAESATLEGVWMGRNEDGDPRIVIRIKKIGSNEYSGTIQQGPDPGEPSSPSGHISTKDGLVLIEINGQVVRFEGKMNSAGTELTGKWIEGKDAIKFKLKRYVEVKPGPETIEGIWSGNENDSDGPIRMVIEFDRVGAGDSVIRANRHFQEKVFNILAGEKDPEVAHALLTSAVGDEILADPAKDRPVSLWRSANIAADYNSPWMRYFISNDPAAVIKSTKCPVLAKSGDKDLEIPPDLGLPVIEPLLKAGGNSDVTIKLMPGLNDQLQTCKTGLPSEYATIDETVSPLALQTLGDWIAAHTK